MGFPSCSQLSQYEEYQAKMQAIFKPKLKPKHFTLNCPPFTHLPGLPQVQGADREERRLQPHAVHQRGVRGQLLLVLREGHGGPRVRRECRKPRLQQVQGGARQRPGVGGAVTGSVHNYSPSSQFALQWQYFPLRKTYHFIWISSHFAFQSSHFRWLKWVSNQSWDSGKEVASTAQKDLP